MQILEKDSNFTLPVKFDTEESFRKCNWYTILSNYDKITEIYFEHNTYIPNEIAKLYNLNSLNGKNYIYNNFMIISNVNVNIPKNITYLNIINGSKFNISFFNNLPNNLEFLKINDLCCDLINLPPTLNTLKISSYDEHIIKLPFGSNLITKKLQRPEVSYIYLDNEERNRFASLYYQTLINELYN
jgi:hypothetical protein